MRVRAGGVFSVAVMAAAALAQAPAGPVVNPRGVLNAFTQQPAPSVVGRGGLIYIHGLRLGPPEGVKASGPPWPTKLGDPPVEVLLNGRPVPIFSAAPERIVAQVPWEAPAGLVQVVVRRAEEQSRAARIYVDRSRPSLRTAGDNGYGPVAGTLSGGVLTVSASGLGVTEPRVESGEAGPQDPPAKPGAEVRVYVGGIPANAAAVLSNERVGEFDIQIEAPAGAQPGDMVAVYAGNRAANFATLERAGGAEVRFAAPPDGAPELRALVGSDLNGRYLIGSAARDENGCYPSFVFDLSIQTAGKIEACLTAANQSMPTPMVAAVDGTALAALVGPPPEDRQNGVSSKVRIFDPARPESLSADLGASAASLLSAGGGDFAASIPGTPRRTLLIDAQTGEVRERAAEPSAGSGVPAGPFTPKVDLGDGFTHVLTFTPVAGDLFSVLVADDGDQPTKAKVAVVNRNNEVQGSRDFPEGWAPLIPPRPPETPGRPAPLAGGAGALPRSRVTTYFDAPRRAFYVLGRNADNTRHGIVAFVGDDAPAQVIGFPDSWFAAACSATIDMFPLELTRKMALVGSNVPEIEFKNPCPGLGFILFDLNAKKTTAVPLPGQGQFNVARGASNDLNDFIYGSNTDPSRNNTADTLFVLDGVTASVSQISLPPGITSFGSLRPLPAMNALIGPAANSAAGDAGLVYFDLESMQVRVLPAPEGFARVELLEVFTATRKVVARGMKRGGSQFLIYDLVSGDLTIVPNPDGVAAVGSPPPRPPQPGGGGTRPAAPPVLERANVKANTVAAAGYDAEGRQVGVMVVRVP